MCLCGMVGAAVTGRVLAFFIGPTSVLLSTCMHVLVQRRRKREGKSGASQESTQTMQGCLRRGVHIRHLSPRRVSVDLYNVKDLLSNNRPCLYSQLWSQICTLVIERLTATQSDVSEGAMLQQSRSTWMTPVTNLCHIAENGLSLLAKPGNCSPKSSNSYQCI
jgi:hypothetical protein